MNKPDRNFQLEDQRSFISEIAEQYVRDRYSLVEKISRELAPLRSFLTGNLVLELGAGGGVILRVVGEWADSIIGIEIVREMISSADASVKRRMILGDGAIMPFRDSTFDTVLCWGNTLGPIPGEVNRSKLLVDAYRVLKPGGFLCLSVLNKHSSPRRWLKAKEYLFHYQGRSERWKSTQVGYNRYFSHQELKKLLRSVGFRTVRRISSIRDATLAVVAEK